MWELMGTREGTFYFENLSNFLDQFLVNKNMVKATSPIQAVPGSVEILRLPGLVNAAATHPAAIAFGGMGKPVNQNGYSDHLPIGMQVQEAD